MTGRCLVEVLKLEEESGVFNDLSIEQLLYACVKAVGVSETKYCLLDTDWSEYITGDIK